MHVRISRDVSDAASILIAGNGRAAAVLAAIREHALLIAIVEIHAVFVTALPWMLGRPLRFGFDGSAIASTIATIMVWTVLAAGIVGFLRAAMRRRAGRPLESAAHWLYFEALRTDRMVGGIIVMLLLSVFAYNFVCLKAAIPLLHSYDWDAAFAATDRWLHFGRQPWEWLQPLVGFPRVTAAIGFAYVCWFPVLYVINAWQAFSVRDRALRMQYLLCMLLLWILLGNVGATLLASGGPVYYGRLAGGADPFLPLMRYLDDASASWPIFSRTLQERIWPIFLATGHDGVAGNAISAMPSLHVATSACFYLVVRAANPRLAPVFWCFLFVILIGSIHLGWHYAIDSYAGIGGTALLWRASGWLVRWPPLAHLLWGQARPAPVPLVA